MTKKVIYLDDVLEAIEKCEHYPLFDTKKIKEGIVDFLGLGIGYWDIKEAIEQLPSAQPEIIRCKDCNNWDTTWQNDWAKNYHYCPVIDGVRNGDWYCADAERRIDETD